MVKDLIKNTKNNLKINDIKSLKDVYNLKGPIVSFSNKFINIEKEIRYFLRSKIKKLFVNWSGGKSGGEKVGSEIF